MFIFRCCKNQLTVFKQSVAFLALNAWKTSVLRPLDFPIYILKIKGCIYCSLLRNIHINIIQIKYCFLIRETDIICINCTWMLLNNRYLSFYKAKSNIKKRKYEHDGSHAIEYMFQVCRDINFVIRSNSFPLLSLIT